MADVPSIQTSFSIARDLNLVTIYAAFVSTTVLVWQVFTYMREGARLKGRASANMQMTGTGRGTSAETYVVLNIVNVGTAATTITHIVMFSYDGWWQRCRQRPAKTFITMNRLNVQPIPYVLEVGRTYMAMMTQTTETEQLSRDTLLYIGVIHAFRDKPVLARIHPIVVSDQPSIGTAG